MPARRPNAGKSEAPEVLITRTFSAPLTLVWRAWTDPAYVKAWWGPKGFNNATCEADLRVGGRFRLQMCGPDGALYPCVGVYREIVERERIVYTSEAQDGHPCGAGIPPRAMVTVRFSEQDGKTTVVLHTRFGSAEDKRAAVAERFVISWQEVLERLAQSIEAS